MGASEVVALVAAAVGAFLGSTSAFLLEAWRRARAEENLRYGLILEGQFALAMQLRTLVNIRDQYLKPDRDAADRFMLLVPFYGESNDPTVDLGALGFVAVEDEIDVLQKLHMAQDAYLTAMFALRSRNDMMAEVYAAAVPRGDFDFESGAETVGVDARLARRLKGITDGLYKSVDSAIELEHEAIALLAAAGKRLLPKRAFAAVEELAEGSPS
jgi:hypothetical protein